MSRFCGLPVRLDPTYTAMNVGTIAWYRDRPDARYTLKSAAEGEPTIAEGRLKLDGEKHPLTLKVRYKQPDGDTSRELSYPIADSTRAMSDAPADFRFAAAVAEFGMVLRDSKMKGTASYPAILQMATSAQEKDADGYRGEFVELVRKAQELSVTKVAVTE